MVPQVTKLPPLLVWTVCLLSVLPFVLNRCGIVFEEPSGAVPVVATPGGNGNGPGDPARGTDPAAGGVPASAAGSTERAVPANGAGAAPGVAAVGAAEPAAFRDDFVDSPAYQLFATRPAGLEGLLRLSRMTRPYNREQAAFTVLEWTAFCVALCIVGFSVAHYLITRDVTTPILGAALFFSATLDAFRTLAVTGLTESPADTIQFVPFTAALARLLAVLIILAGTLPFLRKEDSRAPTVREHTLRYLFLAGMLVALLSFAIVHICAGAEQLPHTILTNALLVRPWDAPPLVLYMLAGGIVLPRFRQKYPSLFSHGLLVSIVPLVVGQFHAAFGRPSLIVNHVNISLLLKILAYLVPLAGLVLDYVRAHQSEFLLRTTDEKLKVARRLQLGLLPQRSPEVPGFDLAGASHPADAVGGDYFDYLSIPAGRTGIVVADVSGHELGAALLLAQTRAYLRALAGAGQELEWTVGRLNEFLVQDVQHRWFVTMFYLELDPHRAAFRYAAAGHEAYVLRRAGTVERLRSTSPPLGVLEGTALACGPEVVLESGDVVLVTTDGITEAHDPHRDMFGVDRLNEVVARHRARPAQEIVAEVLAAVAAHTGGGPQLDDMTVVVAKCLDSHRRT